MVLLSLSFDSLHGILRRLYDEMTELCQPMMTLATAIAALGALFYIAYRVWQSLSRAEPVDVFGMLRPFCLGICILFFDVIVLGSLNGILSPVVQGTGAMLHDQTFDVRKFQEEKDRLLSEMPLKVAVTGEFNPTDEELEKDPYLPPYYHPGSESPEIRYMLDRRRALGGFLPERRTKSKPLPLPGRADRAGLQALADRLAREREDAPQPPGCSNPALRRRDSSGPRNTSGRSTTATSPRSARSTASTTL